LAATLRPLALGWLLRPRPPPCEAGGSASAAASRPALTPLLASAAAGWSAARAARRATDRAVLSQPPPRPRVVAVPRSAHPFGAAPGSAAVLGPLRRLALLPPSSTPSSSYAPLHAPLRAAAGPLVVLTPAPVARSDAGAAGAAAVLRAPRARVEGEAAAAAEAAEGGGGGVVAGPAALAVEASLPSLERAVRTMLRQAERDG